MAERHICPRQPRLQAFETPQGLQLGDRERYTDDDRKMAAINNALGLLSSGHLGEQEEIAFIGSYNLDWKVVGGDANGDPVVEFHLLNNSTAASISLDKNKVHGYGPNEAQPGESYTRQEVRWRETFVDGKADYANSRYGNPAEKDPRVPDLGYKAAEYGLKGGLWVANKVKSWF